MLRETIYQIYLGIKSGEDSPASGASSRLLKNLDDIEISSYKDIDFNAKQNDLTHFLDDSLLTIFNITETPTKSELGRGIFYAKKLLLAAEIFNFSLLKYASNFAAEKALKVGKKYFALDVVFQSNRIILSNAKFFKNKKRRRLAKEEFHKYLEYYRIERAIEIDYLDISLREQSSVSHNKETAVLCGELLDKYQQYQNKIPSLFFHATLFNLQYLKASHEKSMDKVYEVARTKTEYFSKLDIKYIPGLNHGYSIQLMYFIQTRDFKKGEEVVSEANNFLPQNTVGTFIFLSIVTKLKLHSDKYNEAISLVFRTLNHKKFSLMAPLYKRDWYLYEAYVNLLLETGHATYDGRRRRFSIQRFINDLPSFSKDKKAMNIPILIAQMLFFITRKQYNKAIDRIESLGKYTSRYLSCLLYTSPSPRD